MSLMMTLNFYQKSRFKRDETNRTRKEYMENNLVGKYLEISRQIAGQIAAEEKAPLERQFH